MRQHRFYTDIPLAINQSFDLPKEASHHCLQVLRYQIGAQIVLFNGDGFDYSASIEQINNKQCQVKITESHNPENESPLKIHLYQGIARGDKIDFIIQKSVELGVSEITPIVTQRCNVKLDAKRQIKKHQHWQKVAISAGEQSGRAIITKINPVLNLKEINVADDKHHSIYLTPEASKHLHSIKPSENINVFIGPEGGFAEEDLRIFKQSKVEGIKLGPRILRTETAGPTILAILQSCFGDL